MKIEIMQEAIRRESLDGWLFCNFHHRDTLTDALLGLSPDAVGTRSWYYLVPAMGIPVKMLHPIETHILDSLPGESVVYDSRNALRQQLSAFSGKKIAVLSDPELQILSTTDAASYNLFDSCGMRLESAARLIQRVRGLIDREGIASHERAASALYGIIAETWKLASNAYRNGETLHEKDLRDYILKRFSECGLETDHPPIVAAGISSADPHYDIEPGTKGRPCKQEEVIQFDIWAKEPGGIYADISWVGYLGTKVPAEIEKRFSLLAESRDLVKKHIETAYASGKPVAGRELDAAVRAFLLAHFPPQTLRHRTGHGIDTDCHGSGTNLDSVEFPDTRPLLEGSCFSVEPGLYFDDYGMRTEIDIYIRDGKPVVSGGEIQHAILKVEDNQS
jgi:Xaa-Pro aminopeptidase